MSIEYVEVKTTLCSFLFWHHDGWYTARNFHREGKSACERKTCGKRKCHNFGKEFDEYARIKGQLGREANPVPQSG